MNGGRLLIELLKEQEAKAVFGVPGGQTLYANDPLEESPIRFIHTRHEGAAASAADAYGRLTGRPGICLATTGPGATNLLTGIGGALRDSSPMIVLLFQNRIGDVGKGDAQEANHEAIFSGLCKRFIPVPHISKLPWAVRTAYREALSGRRGPVVLDLYRDVVEEQQAEYVSMAKESYCAEGNVVPAEAKLEEAARLLEGSEKIAILSGNGVKIGNSGDQVMALARLLNAPVVTTFNGISGVSTEEPLVYGPRSRHGIKLTRNILEEADLVVVLGSSLSAISTNRWALKLRKILQIDIDAAAIGCHYPVESGLVGEIGATLALLNSRLETSPHRSRRMEWLGDLDEKQKEYAQDFQARVNSDEHRAPASPAAVMNVLNTLTLPDSILCVDAGNPGAWAHLLKMKRGMKFIKPVNYGNMGFAIPAGIAAKEACPEKEVISILGDGSLGMTLAELETAARLDNQQIIIVLNDSAYGNIRQEELFKFGPDVKTTGVDFSPCDYAGAAKALGCAAYRTENADGLREIIGSYRESGMTKPCFIEVKIDGSISVWPEIQA